MVESVAQRMLARSATVAQTAGEGLGVVRGMVPKDVLERLEPALKGKLHMPAVAGEALIGARRLPGDIKVGTANLHMGAPAGAQLSNVANESIDALRADAAAILREDPDVVFLQEVRHHPMGTGTPGVAEQASVMGHLLGASDVAFTPAVARIEGLHEGYGTAIVLRKGATFDQVFNQRLTNHDPLIEARSIGWGHVKLANGDETLVGGTHLANRPLEDAALRAEQLHDIGGTVASARATGTFAFDDVVDGTRRTATGLPKGGAIVAGDMNQLQAPTSEVLDGYGLTNVSDTLAAKAKTPAAVQRAADSAAPTAEHEGVLHTIDHIEADKAYDVVDAGIVKVGDLVSGPTDHHFKFALLRRQP